MKWKFNFPIFSMFFLLLSLLLVQDANASNCTADLPPYSPIFTHAPADITRIDYVVPLGNINPEGNHVLPVDHLYLMIKDGIPGVIDVHAMAAGQVVSVSRSLNQDRTGTGKHYDYQIMIRHSCNVFVIYDHLQHLTETLKNTLAQSQGALGNDFNNIDWGTMQTIWGDNLAILSAGDIIGDHDHALSNGSAFDIGTYDRRLITGTTINYTEARQRYSPEITMAKTVVSAQCFWKYMGGSLKSSWSAIMNPTNVCGKNIWDVPGTLQGSWYNPAVDTMGVLSDADSASLNFIPYNTSPDTHFNVSFGHKHFDNEGLLAILDEDAIQPVPYYPAIANNNYDPVNAPDFNVPPIIVTPHASRIVCYELKKSQVGESYIYNYLLVKFVDAETVKARFFHDQTASCTKIGETYPDQGSNWKTFVRSTSARTPVFNYSPVNFSEISQISPAGGTDPVRAQIRPQHENYISFSNCSGCSHEIRQMGSGKIFMVIRTPDSFLTYTVHSLSDPIPPTPLSSPVNFEMGLVTNIMGIEALDSTVVTGLSGGTWFSIMSGSPAPAGTNPITNPGEESWIMFLGLPAHPDYISPPLFGMSAGARLGTTTKSGIGIMTIHQGHMNGVFVNPSPLHGSGLYDWINSFASFNPGSPMATAVSMIRDRYFFFGNDYYNAQTFTDYLTAAVADSTGTHTKTEWVNKISGNTSYVNRRIEGQDTPGALKGIWMNADLHNFGNPIIDTDIGLISFIPDSFDYKYSDPNSSEIPYRLSIGNKDSGTFGPSSYGNLAILDPMNWPSHEGYPPVLPPATAPTYPIKQSFLISTKRSVTGGVKNPDPEKVSIANAATAGKACYSLRIGNSGTGNAYMQRMFFRMDLTDPNKLWVKYDTTVLDVPIESDPCISSLDSGFPALDSTFKMFIR